MTLYMKIAVAADHAGLHCKNRVVARLREAGHEVLDLGAHDETPVDYPEYGFAVGEAVVDGGCDRGVVVCGSSVGISIAANKVPGVRCAAGYEPLSTELARRHNDINVIALSERLTGWEMTQRLLDVFLETPFEGGRHVARVMKLNAYDHASRAQAQLALAAGRVEGVRVEALAG